MATETDLKRFIDAQERDYAIALSEIKQGKKKGHWMWYIFPQITGLGFSETSKFYSLHDVAEAEAFLRHPMVGSHLIEICTHLLQLASNDPYQLFGSPDDLKLKSSMTLFASLDNSNPVFQHVLDKFFDGQRDQNTLKIINKH